MAISSVVMLMVLYTSMLQTNGFYFQQFSPLQKTLESVLTTEDTIYSMRQAFLPIFHTYGQEIQLVYIKACVHITVDLAMNSTSCIASNMSFNTEITCNECPPCWVFLWTDSALLTLITIDQLLAFDQVYVMLLYSAAVGGRYARATNISLPLICPVMPTRSDIKTSLIPLLSWSKSYVRYQGAPSQWEESDKGYVQEFYDRHWLAESAYTNSVEFFAVHGIRLVMIVTFTLFNILVLIAVVAYGKLCHAKLCQMTSKSTRLTAVTWASMITVLFVNILYFLFTIQAFIPSEQSVVLPRVWACMVSNATWCASMKSTKLYSDEVASVLVKLTVVPFTIVVELVTAVRLTRYALLPLPWTQWALATRPRWSFRIVRRVVQTILIWNVMVFIQTIFGVILLPVGIFMVIAPGATISLFGTLLFIAIEFTVFVSYFILRQCNVFSLKQCCSLGFFVRIFIAFLIFLVTISVISLYYVAIELGVRPWSVKGSILSFLPSFLVTPLLWFAKRYFFKKDKVNEEVLQVLEQNGFSMIVRNRSATHLENSNEEEDGRDEEGSEEDDDTNEERRLLRIV